MSSYMEAQCVALCALFVGVHVLQENKRKREEAEQQAQRQSIARNLALSFLEVTEPEEGPRKKRSASRLDHARASAAVHNDYLAHEPVFSARQFEQTFRITRGCMELLMQACGRQTDYFTQKYDALGEPGIDPNVKMLCALKVLAFGVSPSAFKDYFQIGKTTANNCVKNLCHSVSSDEQLRAKYLRRPSKEDARNLSRLHEERHGIPGMLGSIDCMATYWKNCPVAWQGQFSGVKGKCIMLEALVDYNLWFWHADFGFAGSHNDITIWDNSKLLESMLDGHFTKELDFEFEIAGEVFHCVWILTDGIYPPTARFVQSIEEPIGKKNKIFAVWQEGSRKDVERGFGVLQRKFHFITKPIEYWFMEDIKAIVETCIIMHNMMVEVRLQRDEQESSEWYTPAPTSDDEGDDDDASLIGDVAEEEVAKEMAAYESSARMNELLGNDASELSMYVPPNWTKFEWFTFRQCVADRRWHHLYDQQKNIRLREAIQRQLMAGRSEE